MENTQLPILEDDLFSSRDSSNPKASSSRIHFPNNEPLSNRPRSVQKTQTGLTPPVRRGSPLNPLNASQTADARRRPWPSDSPLAGPSVDSSSRHRRGQSQGLGGVSRMADSAGDSSRPEDVELEVGVFSNEYDLAHEDPRILQDVQRALKLKARREARMKRDTFQTPEKPSSHHTSPTSQLEASPSVPFPATFTPSPSFSTGSHRKSSNSTTSDVDFSPSTGVLEFPSKSHPVPSSLDNGITLDWTGGEYNEGERSWKKSIGKRKEKDKLPPLGLMIDQQEKLHNEKLARISSVASAQTSRKAHITGDQLSRRYNLIYDLAGRKQSTFNLAQVTRWYGSQPEIVRKTMEKSEPFTWLKHLDKKAPKAIRSPWNLSAMIIEEYVQTHEQHQHMRTIPEGSTLSNANLPYPRKSRSPSSLLSPRVPADDRISFEPLGDSKRNSTDASSRKSGESALSSIRSGSSNMALSPVSDSIRDQTTYPTSETPRSPGSSSTESSDDERPTSPKLHVNTSALAVPELLVQPPSSEGTSSKDHPEPISITTSTGSSGSAQVKHLASPVNNQSMTALRATFNLKSRKRIPFSNEEHQGRKRKKARREREEQLRVEYEAKSQLLSESTRHNGRIRQLLNRISIAMKDYDSIQGVVAHNLQVNLPNISKEIIEAFGHDPAGVTGSTRRLRNWQAVEDISLRIDRQRQTFADFLHTYEEEPPSAGCLLDNHVQELLEQLEALTHHNADIVASAEVVSALLDSVQEIEATVKQEYNKTVAHASVVYPQLSHIVALEESYKDQYQQFWELGMDALTLLLDTVTPVWRTYGKTIGEDVRDFLIIPLYRNEFTGEAKRYRIKEFPRRSLQHWVGLCCFFMASIAVNILQVRAAISSTLNFRLLSIPYDGVRWTALPFFWIGIFIQWLAVIVEFAIVFMQLGVIAWWTGWSIKLLS